MSFAFCRKSQPVRDNGDRMAFSQFGFEQWQHQVCFNYVSRFFGFAALMVMASSRDTHPVGFEPNAALVSGQMHQTHVSHLGFEIVKAWLAQQLPGSPFQPEVCQCFCRSLLSQSGGDLGGRRQNTTSVCTVRLGAVLGRWVRVGVGDGKHASQLGYLIVIVRLGRKYVFHNSVWKCDMGAWGWKRFSRFGVDL